MLSYFKFRQDLFGPVPAKDVYTKRPAGRGWPEECPPIRAANGFGFDILANFDVTFTYDGQGWSAAPDVVLESDFDWSADEETEGRPLVQQYAWFWERGQKLPHVITDDVYEVIKHQVKLSSFLFMGTDPNELLLIGELPNQRGKPWRAVDALVDTDWYPASYPWHAVLELDPAAGSVHLTRGEPVCRVVPVRRDTYFAQQMTPEQFDTFFTRGQRWLSTHGKPNPEDAHHLDITRTYVKQQVRSRFVSMD
ncbi:MAG: hypothetical protein ACFCVE_02885 [Phycisphaerae bacterium]